MFPNKVKLKADDHTYWHDNGEQYMGFSELFAEIGGSFDANKIAYFTGGKSQEGMEKTLAKWEEQRSEGVRIDEALTHYLNHGEIRAEHKDIELDILQLSMVYSGGKIYPQQLVYDEDSRTSGTSDTIFTTSNRKDSKLIVSDTKCYEKFDTDLYEGRKWLKAPFEHLPNSKYIKTALQLSFYAHHAEKSTGKKVNELFIHLIQPSTCKNGGNVRHKKIPVPYLKHDIIVLLETFKDQIKERLTPKEFVI